MTAEPQRQEPRPSALAFKAVSKSFRTRARSVKALDGIDAIVRPGLVTGLIGPDAAGKTTLMRLAAGLLVPDRGRILVFGVDVTADSLTAQRLIGYMPQRFGLYEDLTVKENLDLYADLQGVAPAERPARFAGLLRMTGLGPFVGRLAAKLSGGMKQKLGLACTLVRSPRLLLLDEPTVGVDPVARRELWAIVYRQVKEEGTTVLLSTAYLDEAERCDQVLVMHEGRLLGAGDPQSFTRRMAGKSFYVSAPDIGKRSLQERLSRRPGVLDAIIQGEHVRLVTREPVVPDPKALLPGLGGVAVTPVAPRFEDCFIDLLKTTSTESAKGEQSNGHPPASVEPGVDEAEEIVVRGLSRRFGDFYAVKNVSFAVRRGEIFGLLGANGAGKSTTFRMLCGLLPPSAGTLKVAGLDLRRAASRARGRIGYMAQKFSQYPDLSVIQNLRFFSSAYGLWGRRQQTRIDWALDEFELAPFATVTSRDLPLGYKQRLAMAAALMHEPAIVFLDEPTSGVDPLARRDFWRRINALADGGVTVMVTTHFMEEAEFCDRLVIMAQGEILAEGTSEDMKARLRSPTCPEPSMEDAFIALIENDENGRGGADGA